MAWWDYGYEIIRLGRRVPVANPTQAGADMAGRFFTATDEAEAARILDETGARYVIAHSEVPILPRGRPHAGQVRDAGGVGRQGHQPLLGDVPHQGRQGRAGPARPVPSRVLPHARGAPVRLRRRAGAPQDSTYVVTYAERTMPDGTRGKEILESRRFKTYESAAAYLDRFGHTGRTIVGLDPKQTPVPIEPAPALPPPPQSPGDTPRRPHLRIPPRALTQPRAWPAIAVGAVDWLAARERGDVGGRVRAVDWLAPIMARAVARLVRSAAATGGLGRADERLAAARPRFGGWRSRVAAAPGASYGAQRASRRAVTAAAADVPTDHERASGDEGAEGGFEAVAEGAAGEVGADVGPAGLAHPVRPPRGRVSTRASASAKASGRGSTSQPVSPCTIVSVGPPRFTAITGRRGGHRLQRDEAEVLGERRVDDAGRAGEQRAALGVRG